MYLLTISPGLVILPDNAFEVIARLEIRDTVLRYEYLRSL